MRAGRRLANSLLNVVILYNKTGGRPSTTGPDQGFQECLAVIFCSAMCVTEPIMLTRLFHSV
jgi:hypothetical protein